MLFVLANGMGMSGCMSAYKKMVAEGQDQTFSRIFRSDYALCWEAAVDALKASPMEVVNRENGTLQTKWIDNTAERNMLDSNGGIIPYTKAQYRFRVSMAKGFFEGNPSVRVIVQKEQQYQRDVLEGWKSLDTDAIQENALLYRIGKLVEFKARLQEAEARRIKKQLKESESVAAPETSTVVPEASSSPTSPQK